MSKFTAATATEPMEYDFTEYGGGSGVIPEPTSERLTSFFDQMAQLQNTALPAIEGIESSEDSEALAGASDAIKNALVSIDDTLAKAVSDLTNGVIKVEEFKALPFRVQQAFVGWLVGELRPEVRTPGTTH